MKSRTVSAKKKKNRGDRKRPKDVSVEQLVASAEKAMEALDVERAAQLYEQASKKLRGSSSQTEVALYVLEKLGECKVAMGDQDGARRDFQDALVILEQQHSNDTNTIAYHEARSNLYLYAGQLCMEQEALETYQKGIDSLEACLSLLTANHNAASMVDEDGSEHDSEGSTRIVKQKLSGAYCTIAELFLTDLCYEENAEQECESYLEKALQIKDGSDGESFVDAMQTMASLRLSQKEKQREAIPFILRAYDKMKIGCESLAALVGLAEDSIEKIGDGQGESAVELEHVDAANNLPEFEFRCQTAKLLLECAALLGESPSAGGVASVNTNLPTDNQDDQCLNAAISVLGSLLAQNDEVIEVWFLTGCAFAAKRPPLVDTANYYLDQALQMLRDVKKALDQEIKFSDQEDMADLQDQLDENKVQIEDVQAKLAEVRVDTTEDTMEEG